MKKRLYLFSLFLYLGCISFGGPTAHIGLFQKELIEKRQWLSTEEYIQLVAMCQFLPGPTSSQVGMILGYKQLGLGGAFLAWLGFTLPSAMILAVLATSVLQFNLLDFEGAIKGLMVAAVVVVASAILSMCKANALQFHHYIFIIFIAVLYGMFGHQVPQVIWIILAGLLGSIFYKDTSLVLSTSTIQISKKTSVISIVLLVSIWVLLLIYSHVFILFNHALIFYQTGALVFGGGHVVMPLLQQDLVAMGYLDETTFTAGYGFVQAMPGPLFNFASYLGALLFPLQPILGATLSVGMIFLSGALILFGLFPLLQSISKSNAVSKAMRGINLAVIGMLIATFINPLLVHSVSSVVDSVIALILFALLYFNRLPIWSLVVISALFYGIIL